MSEIQANCPHCGTSFTVAEEQLSIANGHVRCGVCMKVFKAIDDDSNSINTTESPNQPSTVQGLDDDASIEAWIKKNQKTGNANIQSGPVEAPEGDIPLESLQFDDEISDDFQDLMTKSEGEAPDFSLEDDDDIDSVPAFAATMDKDQSLDDQLSNLVSEGHGQLQSRDIEHNADDNSVLDDFDDAFGSDLDDDPFAMDDEPVVHVALGSAEIEEEETLESRLQPKILWPSLIAAFSLILCTQVLVKNFDTLALDSSYRSFYSPFCAIGICDLPTQKNLASIRASNLIVRPHPHRDNALLVDAIINNKAPFNQELPLLQLSFSDTQGSPVAARQFTPKEYLQGELAGLKSLPSHSPLHISLEIVDPGETAVGYRIDFIDG